VGSLKNGVYKVVIGRTAKMGDQEIGKDMGINTWAAFAGSKQLAILGRWTRERPCSGALDP